MTVHEPDYDLPFTTDVISEVYHVDMMAVKGGRMWVELLSVDPSGTHSLWKGTLTFNQVKVLCWYMAFFKELQGD